MASSVRSTPCLEACNITYVRRKNLRRENVQVCSTPEVAASLGNLPTAVACVAASIVMPWAAVRVLEPKACKSCYGTGYLFCDKCKARGKVGGLDASSLAVDQDTLSTCSSCCGSGHTACTACNHTGIENYWLWKPAKHSGWGPRTNGPGGWNA